MVFRGPSLICNTEGGCLGEQVDNYTVLSNDKQ